MKELMTAPIVPGTRTQDWTVIHAGNEPRRGSAGCYAFTSRAALTRWAAAREDELRWLALSEVPNRIVLVLDEAWPLKYADPVPEMRSAADGRGVLGKLLQGHATSAQKWFGIREYFLQVARQDTNGDGADILGGVYLLREWYEAYVALDPKNWEANGKMTTEGELVAQIPREAYCVVSLDRVIAKGDGSRLTWRTEYAGPVMVVKGRSIYDAWEGSQKPGGTELPLPLYLRLLA